MPVRWSVGGERVPQFQGLERPFGWNTGCEGSVQGSDGGCQAALLSPAVVQRVQKVLQ